jgi:hypothetical protein
MTAANEKENQAPLRGNGAGVIAARSSKLCSTSKEE